MSDQSTGNTGRWLKRITQSMSGEPRDLAELIEDLREASERGLFNGDALVMLEGVLAVADMQVRDIMVPRAQMVFVERDEAPEKLVEIMVESGHSRFPVIGEDRDQILGIVLAKDLLRLQIEDGEYFEIREYMRPVMFVPESKRLNVLLKEFRQSHNHLAMVVDEYGGVCGLVTIEDVIEQIVGEIDDEHDVEDDQTIRRESDREFSVRALTPIAEFNEYFGTAFSDEEYDTIGGLLMQEFGRLPRRGETISDRRPRVSDPARRPAPHRFAARDHPAGHRAARGGRRRSLRPRAESAQWLSGSAAGEQRLPVEDGVPQHSLIAAIQVAVQGIEVECDHPALADRHVEDGGMSDQAVCAPYLTAHHQRLPVGVAPRHDDAARIERAVQAGGAIGHPQPAPRRRIDRVVLAEHVRVGVVSVGDGALWLSERHPQMRPRRARLGEHRGGRGVAPPTRGAARHAARFAAHPAHQSALERQHRAVAERDEQAPLVDEALNLGKARVADAPA